MLRWWNRLSISEKATIGNLVIIVIGAVVGTYMTKSLLEVPSLDLVLVFATAGFLLSMFVYFMIIRSTMHSISVLQRTIERIDKGDISARANLEEIDDPQLWHFARSLNIMLGRLAAHTRMIESNRGQLRRLAGQVLSAQEDERKRIARELHDDTSGSLARVLLNIDMCEEMVPDEWSEMRERISATRALCEATLENVRKLIFDLRPTLLDDLWLSAAIRWYAKETLESAGVQVQFEMGNGERAPAMVETALFRIAQEAITNIVRHSHAHCAGIKLSNTPERWVLVVRDDGQGFDPAVALRGPGDDQKWGLFGSHERAAVLGGTIVVESMPGQGTKVRVEIPREN